MKNEINLTHAYLMSMVYNIIIFAGFIVLAIIFNKWWLVLFALLFISRVKNKTIYTRVCDCCGEPCSSGADSPEKSIAVAAKLGWYHGFDTKGNAVDYCPKCRKNYVEREEVNNNERRD